MTPWVEQTQYLDSLLTITASATPPKLHPFHPNFLTDYRAYRLGLPRTVVDRVKAYHASGKWITNRSVFQKVTGVLESSYERIALHLKYSTSRAKPKPSFSSLISKKDISRATTLELQKI